MVHLAPGPTPEQIWASDEGGAVRLLQLAATASVIKQLGAGPGRVFHMKSHGEHLAVLWMDQLPDGTLRRFTLTVYDTTGRESMSTVVPHTLQPEQRFLAVHDKVVAIGGSEGLRVWDRATGKPLLQ